MFSEEDLQTVLQDFPKFELCYEIYAHNKVSDYDVVLAIPEGKKCFAWFTSLKGELVCIVLELDQNGTILDYRVVQTSFSEKLAYKTGTVFYGTVFKCKNKNVQCFCVEDMYFYAGKPCFLPYYRKLEILGNIFKYEMSQIALNSGFTIFGLPVLSAKEDTLSNAGYTLSNVGYNVSVYKYRFFEEKYARKIVVKNATKSKPYQNSIKSNGISMKLNGFQKVGEFDTKNSNKNPKTAIFKVIADIEPDIYHLYNVSGGNETYCDVAFVPDYTTSVMMNKLFRKIKENDNLDAIEESDDEEDFQNCDEDKYVYLDRYYNMKCEYNYKFKRWMPISLAKEHETC